MYGFGYTTLISSMSKGVVTPALTARTTAFATATGITDTTILNALNTFDLGLISNGLDTKMKALYPFVGSTATTQKYNFMDARDLDAAFRLQFNGGWSFSSTGALSNATNTFADTYFNPFGLSQNVNSTHISFYQRGVSDIGTSRAKIGAASTDAVLDGVGLGCFSSGTKEVGVIASSGGSEYAPSSSSPATQGLFVISTNGNRNAQHYINGLSNGAAVTQSGLMPNFNIHIGRLNSGSSDKYYFNKEVSFSSIGDGLTTTDVSNLYNLVQTLQTSLGRQV